MKKDAQIDETSSESDMDDDADADDKVVDLVVTTNAIEDSTPLPIDDLDSDDGNDSERILNTYACLFNLNTFASGSDGGVEAGRSEEEVSTVNFSQPVPTVHASAGSSPLPTLASIHGGSVAPSSYADLPPTEGASLRSLPPASRRSLFLGVCSVLPHLLGVIRHHLLLEVIHHQLLCLIPHQY